MSGHRTTRTGPVIRKGVPHPPAPGRATGQSTSQQRVDNEERFPCTERYCPFKTTRQADLDRHIRIAHQEWGNRQPLYPCHGCRYILCTRAHYKSHKCKTLRLKAPVPVNIDLNAVAVGIYQQLVMPRFLNLPPTAPLPYGMQQVAALIQNAPAAHQALQPPPPVFQQIQNAPNAAQAPQAMQPANFHLHNLPAAASHHYTMPPPAAPFHNLPPAAPFHNLPPAAPPPPPPMQPAIPPPQMTLQPTPQVTNLYLPLPVAPSVPLSFPHQTTAQPTSNATSNIPGNLTTHAGHVIPTNIDHTVYDFVQDSQSGTENETQVGATQEEVGVDDLMEDDTGREELDGEWANSNEVDFVLNDWTSADAGSQGHATNGPPSFHSSHSPGLTFGSSAPSTDTEDLSDDHGLPSSTQDTFHYPAPAYSDWDAPAGPYY